MLLMSPDLKNMLPDQGIRNHLASFLTKKKYSSFRRSAHIPVYPLVGNGEDLSFAHCNYLVHAPALAFAVGVTNFLTSNARHQERNASKLK